MGLLILFLLVVVACGTDGGAGDAPPPGEFSHIHALGVDPGDGQLYAATHHGVFLVEDGEVMRMGPLIQDTMAFTIAGPDRFLASGHPDLRNDPILDDDMTPLLGLIESTDHAVTWEPLSLQGEVDFHALEAKHDLVYGADATGERFLVSEDGVRWQTRSQIALGSFGVSPDDRDRLVGITGEGLVVSDNGGVTWTPVDDAPLLAYLDWHDEAGLWAVAADGTVHRGSDQGRVWEQVGDVSGAPQTILADPTGLYVATDNAILRSQDQGESWESVFDLT